MSAGTLYDGGAPTIEVRIYSGSKLLMRELCESEDDAAEVVERWSDVDNLFVVVDDLTTKHGPGDILAPEPAPATDEEQPSIATTTLPELGTE